MSKFKQFLVTRIIKVVQKFGPKEVEVLGRRYVVNEEVFNPKFYITSEFMAKHINVQPEDFVLDMGTGSGIQAITAGQTALKVVAVDINPQAVRCAATNVERHGLKNTISVLRGDLFAPLPPETKFNVIIFTPPYLEGHTKRNLDYALCDPGKSLVKRFFGKAKSYLKPDGYVQMVYSSLADPGRVLDIASEFGWDWSVVSRKKDFFETFLIWKFTPGGNKVTTCA